MITGSFGQIREAYLQARLLFPDEVIQYILQNILASSPSILDVGCGTGIGTRQLHENGAIVMGSDVDATMITTAQKTSPDIPYIVAPAHNLPFKDEQFDAVTAFSAFHWFTDEASLTEIKRVLKKGGSFFVINKNDVSGFRKGYREKLEALLGKKLLSPKDSYDPVQLLQDAGFANVITRVFPSKERFSSEDALSHIQSAAVWNEIPAEKETEAVQLTREHIAEYTENGMAIRNLKVVVVHGIC